VLIPAALQGIIPKEVAEIEVNDGTTGSIRHERQDRQLRRWESARFQPFDYQLDFVSGLLSQVRRSAPCVGMLLLPTGAGKTSTAAQLLLKDMREQRNGDAVTIWIAPQLDLLQQAAETIERVWMTGEGPGSLDIRFVTGKSLQVTGGRPTVLMATPMSAANFVGAMQDSTAIQYLIFDEAHHLGAERFADAWTDITNSAPQLRFALGLSATPMRADESSFNELHRVLGSRLFFPKRLMPDPVSALIERGVLSRVTVGIVKDVPHYCSNANASLTSVSGALTADSDYWTACVSTAQNFGKSLIVYCPDRSSGRLFAGHLRATGIAAEFVDGSDDWGTRIAILERFRDGSTRVLVNVHLLLEGIDAPAAEGALITYRIQSPVRLAQIVGRVMRGTMVGGTATSTILCSDRAVAKAIGDPNSSRDYNAYWSHGIGL
jgi:ATP-dependent helicase IRC3